MNKNTQTVDFLNELVEILLNNLVYYLPSNLIFEGVLDELEGDLPAHFFDELSLLDIHQGIFQFTKKDALEINERLLEKQALLEETVFKLLEKKKELTAIEFEFLMEQYVVQVQFYIFITEWLLSNLEKYQQDEISFSIIGSFKLQHENVASHFKKINTYFSTSINSKKEIVFSVEKLVTIYFPDLISRFRNTTNFKHDKTEIEIPKETEDIVSNVKKNVVTKTSTNKRKKREKPVLSDIAIEKLVLSRVFNVKLN